MISYFTMHKRLTVLCISVWLAGAVLGIYVSMKGFSSEELKAYISDIAAEDSSFIRVFANGFSSDLIFVLVMLAASLFVPLMPVLSLAMGFLGFSVSFGSALLIRYFPFKGVLVSLGAVVLPLAISLPLQFMIFISSMDTGLKIASSGGHIAPCRELIASQILRLALLLAALCAITALEAFISPYIFLMIRT